MKTWRLLLSTLRQNREEVSRRISTRQARVPAPHGPQRPGLGAKGVAAECAKCLPVLQEPAP
jgi:hypothetical protein